MKKILDNELKSTKGGFSWVVASGIVGIALFVVGVLDGFTRPIKCN